MLVLSPETEALIRAKATTTGKTPDEVVREAVAGKQVATADGKWAGKASLAEILAIAKRSAARPLLDNRSSDEIIGYDANGLP